VKFRLRIFSKIDDIPINTKFILVSFLCVILPILTVNLIFLNNLSRTVREREEENFKISYERAKTDIVNAIRESVAVSHSIYTDADIYRELDRYYKKGEYYGVFISSLRERAGRYLAIYKNISNITIYTSNRTIDSGGHFIVIDDEIRESPWYKKNREVDGKPVLYAFVEPREYGGGKYKEFLSLIRTMDGFQRGMHDRVLRIDIDTIWIRNTLKREEDYLNLYIVDNERRVVLSSNDEHIYEGGSGYRFVNFDDLFQDDELLLDYNLGEASYMKGWRLVGVPNEEKVYMAMKQSRNFILLLAFISIFISGILVYIILSSYNYRIKRLSSHMSKFGEGQMDIISLNEGKDEIGQLINNFNKMAKRINNLINDVYKLEIQKRDLELERVQAEINFLQSQMNPHFLFNTLNAILIVSKRNGYTEIIDVIGYLSKTLRRLLSWKDDLVTVDEEISFIEMYLEIEKFRFVEKFKYEILANDDVKNYKIPKMSIQPLVENACKHGIQPKKDHGSITVEVKLYKGEGDFEKKLKISVKDSGVGIPEEKIREILENLEEDIYTIGSIGIKNVYRRLKLYYGEDFKFFIQSTKGKGTDVSFIIPLESKLPDLSNEKDM